MRRFQVGGNNNRLYYALIFIVIFAIPVIVHILFYIPSNQFTTPTWTSGDVLNYFGSAAGALATILGVKLTLQDETTARREEQRLSVIPCITLSQYKVMRESNQSGVSISKTESSPREKPSHNEGGQYLDSSISRFCYIVIGKNGISYPNFLSDEQTRCATSDSQIMDQNGPYCVWIQNPMLCTFLHLTNAGSGPAINLSVSLSKEGQGVGKTGLGTRTLYKQLLPKDSVDVLILLEDRSKPSLFGKYEFEISYSDILGHIYTQTHEYSIEEVLEGETTKTRTDLSVAIEQVLRNR